jgi:hypothetical protein
MKLDQAIEVLSSTYMSLEAVARGLEVDPVEIEKALAKAEPDTTEFVCLTTLAKIFINKTPQESTSNDSTDTEQQ